MPTFTLRLKEVYEYCDGDLGLDDYPIFDEEYRAHLNELIVDSFWFREIAHETIDIFLWRLRTKMRQIMPRYNKMYKAIADLEESDMTLTGWQHSESLGSAQADSTESGKSSAKSDGKQTNSNESKSRTVAMQHPQVRLSTDDDYATSSSDVAGKNSGTTTTSSTQSADQSAEQSSTQYTTGVSDAEQHQGPMAVFNQYWDTIVNIDMMIIEDLEPLFMGIWATNDSYLGFIENTKYDTLVPYMYGPYGRFWR